MLHTKRIWGVVPCEDAEELALKLTEQTWTLCSAFRTAGGTIWVNDSTTEDALQEYAVLRRGDGGGWDQVETITVSWCSPAKLRADIERADADGFTEQLGKVAGHQVQENHERCALCM